MPAGGSVGRRRALPTDVPPCPSMPTGGHAGRRRRPADAAGRAGLCQPPVSRVSLPPPRRCPQGSSRRGREKIRELPHPLDLQGSEHSPQNTGPNTGRRCSSPFPPFPLSYGFRMAHGIPLLAASAMAALAFGRHIVLIG
ncbi:hypothetical protein BS78_03G349600 [Paspalum vaginatum]|nr:hypothetical protein BS78_03G349600 [Paspalum vaginatum]